MKQDKVLATTRETNVIYLDADGLEGKKVVVDHLEQSHARGEVPGNTVHGGRRHTLNTAAAAAVQPTCMAFFFVTCVVSHSCANPTCLLVFNDKS